MTEVLLATDADWISEEVEAALADDTTSVTRVHAGREVLGAVRDRDPDLVVLDLQIGNMGGMATCLGLRLEEGAGRLRRRPVLMLLDRAADVFLGRRSDADGWMVKPLDAFRLRRAATALLDGGSWTEGLPEGTTPPAEPMVPPTSADAEPASDDPEVVTTD